MVRNRQERLPRPGRVRRILGDRADEPCALLRRRRLVQKRQPEPQPRRPPQGEVVHGGVGATEQLRVHQVRRRNGKDPLADVRLRDDLPPDAVRLVALPVLRQRLGLVHLRLDKALGGASALQDLHGLCMVTPHHRPIVVEPVALHILPNRQPPPDFIPLALAGKALQDHKPRLGRLVRARMGPRDLPEPIPQRLLRNGQFIRRRPRKSRHKNKC